MVSALPLRNDRRCRRRLLGIGVVGLGVLLLIASGGYSLYSWSANRDLESMIYKPTEGTIGWDEPAVEKPTPLPISETKAFIATLPTTDPQVTDPPTITLSDTAGDDPLPVQDTPYLFTVGPQVDDDNDVLVEEAPLTSGYLPLSPDALSALGTLPPATRLRIPAINLDADISELAILNLGDSRAYETPNNVVGHTPESANPGEFGNVWLFGHLESLIRGEGSIFRKLPRIPELLKTQPVYIFLETPQGEYVYEAVETDVLHKSELTLYQSDQPSVTLVTCVPRFVYDKRLLVTANLVGFKPAGSWVTP